MSLTIIYIIAAAVVGLIAGWASQLMIAKAGRNKHIRSAELEATKIVDDAKKQSSSMVREAKIQAKDQQFKMKQDFDRETRNTRKDLQKLENRLLDKQEKLDRKIETIERRRGEQEDKGRELSRIESKLEEDKKRYEGAMNSINEELEKVSGMSAEEAKQRLVKTMEDQARREAAKLAKRIEDEAKDNAERKANWIVGTSIQRLANHHVQEKTVSVVQLPSDDLKGRIIGREGRNIRTLEQMTGIDLIVDDTPEAVIISGFNPLRREIARRALEELITDGRIHPARIEEVVHKVEKEMDRHVKELGEQAIFDLGLQNMHPELLKLVGKLNYRTSYGQNQYKHAIEVSFIAGMIASEMGEDVKIAKRGGLLHDIGKVMDHDVEGGHAVIGAEFAKKHGEEHAVWHAIGAHHEDYPFETVMDVIVQAADAISGARPGARREVLENYTKRLEDLEDISTSFDGVEKAFAIQAGREVRVVVTNQDVNDEQAVLLSQDIARKIESDLTYPGQIKITVVRETRAVDYAR